MAPRTEPSERAGHLFVGPPGTSLTERTPVYAGTASERGRLGRWRSARQRRQVPFLVSVRTRVLAAFVVLLALSTLISFVLIRDVLRTRLDREIDRQATREIGEFRRLARGNDPSTGRPFGTDLAAVFDVYFARNLPGERQVILSFIGGRRYKAVRATEADWPIGELFAKLATAAYPVETQRGTVETSMGEARYLGVPVTAGDKVSGAFVVASFPAKEQGEVDDAVRAALQLSGVVFLLAVGLAWLAAGRVLAPLQELEFTAQSISDSDLTRRIPVRGRDEVGQLAATFNSMLERLESAFATQRRFMDDAGHELRTPITIIRGQLELLEDDPEERAETIALVMDELDRMSRIVNDLLLLATSEEPDFLSIRAVDVAELTADWETKAAAIAPRDWQVESRAVGVVAADRQRLTQALLQLAQNAVQHTSAGDAVVLGSAVSAGEARFWVRDCGPGIPLEEQGKIFERFSRGQGALRGEGAGLGLSIVKAIADAHGGRVEVDSMPAAGATFTIVIPAHQSGPEA